MPSLQGHRFLVTGASRGLGRGLVRSLLSQGASVLAMARSRADLDRLEAERSQDPLANGSLLLHTGSILDLQELEQAVRRMRQLFGGLDMLIANAAVHGPRTEFRDAPAEQWEDAVVSNIFGLSRSCRACIPALADSGRGQILVIGSAIGHGQGLSCSAYALSKAMAWSLVKCLSLELEPLGIAVNELIPGPVHTAMNPGSASLPFCRWPEDPGFVGLIRFLCSGAGRPPSGQSFSLRTGP